MLSSGMSILGVVSLVHIMLSMSCKRGCAFPSCNECHMLAVDI